MKRVTIVVILMLMFICAINAQTQNQATVAWLNIGVPADPVLCVFGNTVDDVTILFSVLDFKGRAVQNLNERVNVNHIQNIRQLMERFNARFLAVHTHGMGFDAGRGNHIYISVDIYERVGNNVFRIARN